MLLAFASLPAVPQSLPTRPAPAPDPQATTDAQAVLAASRTTIPASNDDLAVVRRNAREIALRAELCADLRCPVVHDCATAARAFQALVDAEAYLDAMLSALDRAAADSAAAHDNVVAQTRITSTNLEIAQEALAVKEYLYRLATTLSDLASMADDLKDMVEKGSLAPGDGGLQKLDKIYETLKDAEGVVNDGLSMGNDVANAQDNTNEKAPTAPGPTSATQAATGISDATMSGLNELKSALSDVAGQVAEAREAYKEAAKKGEKLDPKDLLGGVSKLAAKTVFRDLKLLVERQMRELQAQIDDLMKNLSAEEKVVAELFVERERIGERRIAAQDTLDVVREAREALARCLARACGMPTVTRPRIPDYYAVPAGVNLGERRGFVGWGNALRDLNGKLAATAGALAASFSVENACPAREDFVVPASGPIEEGPGAIPPHHVVETQCPACRELANEIARLLDEIEYLRGEIDSVERSLEQEPTLKDRLALARRELADLDRYLSRLRDIIRGAQIGSERGAGFNVGGEAKQDLALGEANRVALLERIRYYEREIGRLEARRATLPALKDRLSQLDGARRELRKDLAHCEREMCRPGLEHVTPFSGNNPFDPNDPIGGTSTGAGGQCTAPQPPSQTETVPCPSGQSGSTVQRIDYVCTAGFWVPGPAVVVSSTCSGGPPAQCTTPRPPSETQTLACPSGQTGAITQSRSYSCVNGNWVAGALQTVSNTCTAPPASGCATNFSSGNYSCSGSCGVSSTGLTVTPGSNSMTANPFGANANAIFNCLGPNAVSQSNNLTILGQPGHTCQFSAFGTTSFGLSCFNGGGGSCSGSCSR